MMQVPFLLGVLYFIVRFVSEEKAGHLCTGCLYGMGVLGAIAGAITFNNVLLVGAIGLAAGLPAGRGKRWNLANVLRVWGPAAAVGFPIFILGYVLSGTSNGFLQWVLSYQGDSATRLNELYGIEWTPRGVAISLARAVFYLLSASLIETAGMGATVKALLFRETLEFVPETTNVLLAVLLTPAIAITVIVLLLWALRHVRRERLAQFGVAWIGAFFAFNTLWGSSGDQFYVQVVPAMWVLLMALVSPADGGTASPLDEKPRPARWKLLTLAVAVPALMAVNTLQTVVPVSRTDTESRKAAHMALLRHGDVEIIPAGTATPGWTSTPQARVWSACRSWRWRSRAKPAIVTSAICRTSSRSTWGRDDGSSSDACTTRTTASTRGPGWLASAGRAAESRRFSLAIAERKSARSAMSCFASWLNASECGLAAPVIIATTRFAHFFSLRRPSKDHTPVSRASRRAVPPPNIGAACVPSTRDLWRCCQAARASLDRQQHRSPAASPPRPQARPARRQPCG